MRRRWITASILVALLLLAACLTLFAASRGMARDALREFAEFSIAKAIGAPIAMEALEGPLYPWFEVRQLSVGPADDALLRAQSLRVEFAFEWSWPPTVRILSIHSDAPQLSIRRLPDQDWNVAPWIPQGDSPPEAEKEAESTGTIGRVSVRDAEIAIAWNPDDPTDAMRLRVNATADALPLSFDLSTAPGFRGDLQIGVEPGPLLSSGEATLAIRGGRWQLASSVAHGNDLDLRIEGHGSPTTVENLSGHAVARDLAVLRSLAMDETLAGSLDAEFSLRGSADSPTGELTVRAPSFAIRGTRAEQFVLVAQLLGKDSVRVERLELSVREVNASLSQPALLRWVGNGVELLDVQLELPNGRIRANGGILDTGFQAFHASSERLAAEPMGRWLSTPEALGGLIDFAIDLDGPFAHPVARGNLRWRDPQVGSLTVEKLELEAVTEDRWLRVRGTLRGAGQSLDIRGQVSQDLLIQEPESLLRSPDTSGVLRAENFDLRILSPFLPRGIRSPGGTLDGTVDVKGGNPEPRIEALVTLREGSIEVPILRRTFAPIEGQLRFDHKKAVIESIRVGPEAALTLGGSFDFGTTPARADLRAVFDAFELSRSPLARANLSGNARISGPVDAPRLEGKLAFEKVRIDLPNADDPILREIQVLGNGGSTATELRERPPTPGSYDRAAIDLEIVVPRDTFIRGRGGAIYLEGRLDLRKEPRAALRYTGQANVVRGTYELHNRRFKIRKGTATLAGEAAVDPVLDVEAAHVVRDVAILARISGRASSPSIRLDSEPSLSDADKISYLLFGRPSNEISTTQQGNLQSAGLQLAAGMAAAEASRLLGERFPVDSVDVRLNEDGTLGALGFGKAVSERVFVRYRRTLGLDTEDEAEVELKLSPNWSVESDLSTSGSAGADVIWTFDY